MKKYLFGAITALLLMSCNKVTAETPATAAKPGQIQCYSGGVLIYFGSSARDTSIDTSMDAYVFTEEGTGKLKAVSGDCVVIFD